MWKIIYYAYINNNKKHFKANLLKLKRFKVKALNKD